MKSTILKWITAILLALALILPVFGEIEVDAASKPSLSKTKMTIGIGSYEVNKDNYDKFSESGSKPKYTLSVKNSQKGATYTFTSADEEVATVEKDGTKAYITGVAPGTTTITVEQKLSGKTTKIGTCKVTVKEATLKAYKDLWEELEENDYYGDSSSWGIRLGEEQYLTRTTEGTRKNGVDVESLPMFEIKYYNSNAKYVYECSGEGLQIADSKEKKPAGEEAYYGMYVPIYTATEEGTYTVTVKEIYKGETRVLGSFEMEVVPPTVNEEYQMVEWEDEEVMAAVGSEIVHAGHLAYRIEGDGFNYSVTYNSLGIKQEKLEGSNFSITEVGDDLKVKGKGLSAYEKAAKKKVAAVVIKEDTEDHRYLALKPMNPGTTTLKVYITRNGKEEFLGTCDIVVGDISISKIDAKETIKVSSKGEDIRMWWFEEDAKASGYWGKGKWDLSNPPPYISYGHKNIVVKIKLKSDIEVDDAYFDMSPHITVESSNKSVLAVDDVECGVSFYKKKSATAKLVIETRALKKGKATLTINVDGTKKKITVNVTE